MTAPKKHLHRKHKPTTTRGKTVHIHIHGTK